MAWPSEDQEARRAAHRAKLQKQTEAFTRQERQRIGGLLVGRGIEGVDVSTSTDRLDTVTLHLGDGSSVRFGFWASYADDASLEVE